MLTPLSRVPWTDPSASNRPRSRPAVKAEEACSSSRRDRLAAGREAKRQRQVAQCAEAEPPFAPPGHAHPADEIGPVRQRPGGRERSRHHPGDARTGVGAIDRGLARPGREHGLVGFQRAVADQQAEQIALVFRAEAGPGEVRPRDRAAGRGRPAAIRRPCATRSRPGNGTPRSRPGPDGPLSAAGHGLPPSPAAAPACGRSGRSPPARRRPAARSPWRRRAGRAGPRPCAGRPGSGPMYPP